MNWLTNFVRPKIQALVGKHEVPDSFWDKCSLCEQMIFHRDLIKNLYVCPECGNHMNISVAERVESLMDAGYQIIKPLSVLDDPIKFKDSKKYSDRLRAARSKTSVQDALMSVIGKIDNAPACLSVFNFDFMGGSMGTAVGTNFINAAEVAVRQNAAFIVVTASGGARMQEGILSLVQMSRTVSAINMVKNAGLPYIVVLTNPTTGGVSASLAMLGDVHIAEPRAMICFTGPRVIEETIKQKLPDNFQTSEYLLDHGMIDMVTERKDLKKTLGKIISLLMGSSLKQ